MRADLCETRRYLKSIASSPKFNIVINKAKLTPTQRKVLIMFIAKGFSVRKISLEMSLSDSSTYRLLVAGYESVLQFLRSNKVDGVMFHSDMVLLYTLLNCKEMCEVHWKQLFSEMKTHTCTAKNMIKRYGRIIEAKPTEKISVYTSDTVPETEEEVEKLKTLAFNEWIAWEHETKELYEKMVAMQPHVKMWTELLKDVKMELKAISRLKK